MPHIKYIELGSVEPYMLIKILNKGKVRSHLVNHDQFDEKAITKWINGKIEMDAKAGCKIRGVKVEHNLAGWCGIQLEENHYEMAIVIDDQFWGIGTKIFRDIMSWAAELGHKFIYINFLHTRPEYRFLRKVAKRVFENEILGERFITYELKVKNA